MFKSARTQHGPKSCWNAGVCIEVMKNQSNSFVETLTVMIDHEIIKIVYNNIRDTGML